MHRSYNSNNSSAIASAAMIVIGLILVLWPGHVMTTAMTLIGLGLMVAGAVYIVAWARGRSVNAGFLPLAEGIVMAVGGLVLIAAQRLLISVVPFIIGLFVLINGIVNLAQALDLKRCGYHKWASSLVLAAVTLIAGLIVMLNPFSTMEKLVMVIGLVIIYNGASNLWITSRYYTL